MSHPILVEGPYPDSPTKEPENYSASVLGSLLDDLRNQLSRPPGSIWLQPKNDPQNFPLESSRFTPGLNKEEQATRCEAEPTTGRTKEVGLAVRQTMIELLAENCRQ